jgi:MFS family permease
VDPAGRVGPGYKWVALSNTTLGVLMATINSSIVIIAMPDIFRGIHLDPLKPANISYLLWIIMGYIVVTAVLVVTLGRLGDMFGRVRIYNLGFVVFSLGSIALAVDPYQHGPGALWLVIWRLVQGVGGAMLMANSTAILTDAFPAQRRGLALGVNGVAAIGGSFIGFIVGGLLGPLEWRAVFLVSVVVGVVGTAWSYRSLKEIGVKTRSRIDWPGNISFAAGVTILLAAITYGIQPYAGHDMGWTNPLVYGGVILGVAILVGFCVIETRVAAPMFHLGLYKIRAFAAGNLANLFQAVARGGLTFMLIIWLQGIWLPLHGYNFIVTPLWAAIYMVPLTVGFLIAGPISGSLSDRFGARAFATGGLLLVALGFLGLLLIPTVFNYWVFAVILFITGIGSGLFSAPNTTAVMNAVPADQRGQAAGMRSTLQNSGMALSIGIFFSLMIIGLSEKLPGSLFHGLASHGVSKAVASHIAGLPPVGSLFAAFLGYNPIGNLLGSHVHQVSGHNAGVLTGKQFFPHLIAGPFNHGLLIVFAFSIALCLISAAASALRGGKYYHGAQPATTGIDTVATAAAGPGGPTSTALPQATTEPDKPEPDERPLTTPTGAETAMPTSLTAGPDGTRSVVHGRVYTHGTPTPAAVLTLADAAGRQIDHTHSHTDGTYHLTAPEEGTYLLICQPSPEATAGNGTARPRAAWVSVNGIPLTHDID